MNSSEKTIRGNGKWAKVSGKCGAWTVAMGWDGEFKASKVQNWHIRDAAMIAARYWLAD